MMKSLTCCKANNTSVGVKAVRTDPAVPAMKLLTGCKANRNRVGMMAVRQDPAAPAMQPLTSCQPAGQECSESSQNKPSCIYHEITHFLCAKPDQSGSEGSKNRPRFTCYDITYKLSSKQDKGSRVMEVRPDPAAYAIKLLTSFQAKTGQSGSESSENRLSYTCDEITNFL